ncbi:hypothetical protein B0T17DRAFT_488944 [Bombardia bombarda]|uniref:Zn(2)-C6 fungal-type domain-containing protein n=1 Tax=Bombardia bombarda TaxID=252184 RepID=A0AA39X7W3_9PEZI|nr:hypothetical protein B0T17DRAFT_488944 [Bombardia bombarda]
MMRRRHKKSRRGCLECKRRHIKCDETRPQCINCVTAERACPYPASTTSPASAASASSKSGSPQMPRAGCSPGPVPGPAPGLHLLDDDDDDDNGPPVNLLHMELLYHYLTDTFASYSPMSDTLQQIIMRHALREPYLMYQVLAVSARHLSVLRPQQADYYHDQAIELQTRALSLFNAIDLASLTSRVPVFVFSSTLGFHALYDMLSHRDDTFASALARFTGYLRLHRGVYHVMDGHGDEIAQSELKPIIELGKQWYVMAGEGHECDDLRARIEARTEELEAARRAISLLQCVFDGKPTPAARIHVLLAWTTMIPRPFVAMLEAGRPEAMAVLAYYFLALHLCREVWIIGDSGRFLLESVAAYLGPEWAPWMERPCQMLQEVEAVICATTIVTTAKAVPMATQHAQFAIQRPSAADAPRIARIHLAAMDTNPLLHAQFPTPSSLLALEDFLTAETADALSSSPSSPSSSSGVLVARDPETGVVAGFAKWDATTTTVKKKTKLEEGELRYAEGCRREFLDGYAALAEEAKKRSFGHATPCYQLNFVCTDPAYQGRGAGSLLTRTVLDMAAAEGLPVYLESTMVAVPLYEKLGFRAIDGFEMGIPRRGSSSDELSETYREICMVWYPPPAHE